jgi:outer membrane protein assembly factor BamB
LEVNQPLTFKWNKRTISKISIIAVLIVVIALLSGCVKGMSPVGWSGVLVTDEGTAYTGSKEGRLTAVNLKDSSRQFAEPLKAASTGGSSCSALGGGCSGATPAIAVYGTPVTATVPVLGKLIYMAGYNGKVFAYDASSLQQRWVYPVDANVNPIVSSLVIYQDKIYFGDTDGNIYALNLSTGAFLWRYQTAGQLWASPVIADNVLIIGSFDKNIYALNATSGEFLWKAATSANITATAIVDKGVVYVGSLDSTFYALDAATGNQLWNFKADNWFWAKAVAANNLVFASSLDNKVYALDARNGNKVAEYNLEAQIASDPVLVSGKLIVATKGSSLWSIDTTNTSLEAKKITTIAPNVTSPLGANGNTVYINSPDDNKLYWYDITTGAGPAAVSLSSK